MPNTNSNTLLLVTGNCYWHILSYCYRHTWAARADEAGGTLTQ